MVTLVQDGLLLNLDPYYEAFGWDAWPASVLAPHRVGEGGRPRGEGSLYANGFNVPITGVYYNRRLAEQIGMTEPPATLQAFEDSLAAAKEAGIQPIMQWNASASGGGLAFPLQNLMASVGPTGPINEWIYQKEGATIDTPSNLEAAKHLETWIKNGYFPEDVNAIEYVQAADRFAAGEALYTFNGTWQNATYDGSADDIGFFLFPPAEEGGTHGSMGVPVTFGIAANAKNADCAAFFFDWVGTNPEARQINVTQSGSAPVGPGGSADPDGRGGVDHQRDARRGRRGLAGERAHGLHRQRDRRHLRRLGWVDAGAPEPRRWPPDAGGSAPDRPGDVRGGPRPVIEPSRWRHEGGRRPSGLRDPRGLVRTGRSRTPRCSRGPRRTVGGLAVRAARADHVRRPSCSYRCS